jgi:hypothetical protein
MATKPSRHNCVRCQRVVLVKSAGYVRACRWGQTQYWHWSCFAKLMRESEQAEQRKPGAI